MNSLICAIVYMTLLNFVVSAPMTESTLDTSTEYDTAVTKRHVLRQAPGNHRPIINFFTHHNNNGMRPGLFGNLGNHNNAVQGVDGQQPAIHRPSIFRPFANFGNHNNIMAPVAPSGATMGVPLDPISAERLSSPFIAMYPGYISNMGGVSGMGGLAAFAPASAPIAVFGRDDGIADFAQQANFFGNENYFTGGLIPDENFGLTGFPSY